MTTQGFFIHVRGFRGTNLKSLYVRMALIGLCTVSILLGLTSGNVLAHDDPTLITIKVKRRTSRRIRQSPRPVATPTSLNQPPIRLPT